MLHRGFVSLLAGTVLAGIARAEAPADNFDGASALQWSERLARSEMKRLGTTLEARPDTPARWDYSPAVLALGMLRLGEATGEASYSEFGRRAVETHVNPDGTIKHYTITDYSIDNILPGRVVLDALRHDPHNEADQKAVDLLRKQMRYHPRTTEGAFWHKLRYPTQIWLDGLYMASPFLAQYAQMNHEPALFDDVARQLVIANRHLYDPKTELYWHAWDEDHAQRWADPATGLSPHFWTRAIGWYGLALLDCLDYLPTTQPELPEIKAAVGRVAAGVLRWQDPASGLWWQVTDAGSGNGNYLEASGSAMCVYIMAKGVREGYLPRDKYLPAIMAGYEGLIHTLLKVDPNGKVRLTEICKGAGLGSAGAGSAYRDGSFRYYVGETKGDNDPKGTGAFIMAGVEVERVLQGK